MVRSDTAQAAALALPVGVCHKGGVKRLRDFEGIAAFFSEREIDEIQAAADARRAARLGRPWRGPATPAPDGASGPGTPKKGRRAG